MQNLLSNVIVKSNRIPQQRRYVPTAAKHPPGLHPSITDFAELQVQTLDLCVHAENSRHCLQNKRWSSNQSENIPAWLVPGRNNLHSLKLKEVRHSQGLPMSEVKATSGQLISDMFTGLGPFIAAAIIARQIDANDRFVALQGCG